LAIVNSKDEFASTVNAVDGESVRQVDDHGEIVRRVDDRPADTPATAARLADGIVGLG
jgi:hypothetical protein